MSGTQIFMVIVGLGFLAYGWFSKPAVKSRRLDYSMAAVWAFGTALIFEIFGEDHFSTPFFVFSAALAGFWFLGIFLLPRSSQVPERPIGRLKELLLGLAPTPMIFLFGWFVDHPNWTGYFLFMVFIILQALHRYLVRVRTGSRIVPLN